ncbi:hypothetical protein [Pedobacter gandavensis]|uniref:hypothetical protein n=1 Tax=Pedobacter gandavensis TaxID=2679963 RepID=UPI00292DDB2E|nr:hypothetical protein [Pedobacter gandavensis]
MNNAPLTALLNIPEEAGYFFPNRHFERICDNELYSLMIEKLEEIPQIDKIIVNTDSGRIRGNFFRSGKVRVINVYKAEAPEIEMELTSDKMTTVLLEHTQGEHFLQLGPIFPFLRPQTIQSVIDTYNKYVINQEDFINDSIFTIKSLNRRYYNSDINLIGEDRPNTFVEDGIMHIFNRSTFVNGGNRKVGKNPFAYIIEEIENLAIDSEENYRLAVLIDKNRHQFPRIFNR